jgi:transcriptional regulator with PAS, ATPase and Fis domain
MKNYAIEEILQWTENREVALKQIDLPKTKQFKSNAMADFGVFSDTMEKELNTLQKIEGLRHIPILILGSTGAGKEMMAQYLHYEVDNDAGPYLPVNCAAINKELFEAQLFGYVKGAFTGASREGSEGYIEKASGGTLFLDEITEISTELQVKLLRVLQEKEFMRVGDTRKRNVNCRIVCASNRDIKEMVKIGRFREDLYYRLTIVRIDVPPLMERKVEIIPMMVFFIQQLNEQLHKNITHVESMVLRLFYSYKWPGNVRELKNFLTQIMIFIEGNTIRFEHLKIKEDLDRAQTKAIADTYETRPLDRESIILRLLEQPLDLEEFTQQVVQAALKRFRNNKAKTARYLGLKREQLYNRYRQE